MVGAKALLAADERGARLLAPDQVMSGHPHPSKVTGQDGDGYVVTQKRPGTALPSGRKRTTR